MSTDEAIVLAGGLGTRLREVVADVPKPLAPVAGRPFLAWVLDALGDHGMRHLVLATGYLSEMIEEAVGSDWKGMRISYSVETEPMGTGGAVALARSKLLGDAAHLLNGDTYLEYSALALESLTRVSDADIGIALAEVPDIARYGAVSFNDRSQITAFAEKGGKGGGYINAGCYFLCADALARLTSGRRFSFETEVLLPLARAGRVVGLTRTAGFIDIGVPDDYRRAQQVFAP